MDGAALQAVVTLAGIIISGLVGLASGKATAKAQQATATISAGVQAEANETKAAEAVVAGAIALSQGVRTELDAVRADLDAERKANREQRTRMLERIEHLEKENQELRQEVAGLTRQTRPRSTRSRTDDA